MLDNDVEVHLSVLWLIHINRREPLD